MNKLIRSLLWCALLLRADFEPSSWKFRRPLPVEAKVPIAVVNIDRGIYVHSQPGLSDLRVVSGQGELPYVLERMSGSRQRTEVSSNQPLNQGVTASGDLELTVDVGTGQRHNGIRLSTNRANFRQRVGVATSDDGRAWTRVRDDGYIFDFSQDEQHVSVLDVGYPVSSRRYVRLTVYGWNDPKAVGQAWITLDKNEVPVRDVMATLKADPRQDTKTQSTLYSWDLGVSGIPYDQLTLVVGSPAFERAARVETSQDGTDWQRLADGVLSRFEKEESLTVELPESHDRYLRLRIYNRDDQPIAVETATLSVVRSQLKFKPPAGGSYWLYYGNADAHTPSYDLREQMAREGPLPEATISAGPEEPNPAYREKPVPAKPWSEQHQGILYITLALAVVSMGVITVRFLRKAGAESR
jgi:Protein of unknown function (DUF3999)